MKLPLLILLTSLFAFQTANPSFKVDGDLLASDKFGNIYTGTKDVLVKYDKTGLKKNTYSNKTLGNVTHLDVSNPLRLLVYYKDVGKVVFLDNTLSVHNEVELERFGYGQTSLACSSNNNSFWIYDLVEYQLIRLDEQLKEVQNTGNLIQLLGIEINPDFLIEANDRIYLSDEHHGIFVFDVYGGFLKTIPIKGLKSFQINKERIIYAMGDTLKTFNLKTLHEQNLNLSKYHPDKIITHDKIIIVKQGNNITTIDNAQ